ncbi:MAG: hypothetical protein J0I18_23610 [Actinobacteria bacterium]|nr:hypothetical protein [Actinomycetota bacterium]
MTDFSQHPWLPATPQQQEAPPPPVRRELPRPAAPQPGVPAPDQADRLPRRDVNRPAPLWWLGVHGGAGESTLAQLVPGSRAAGHAWPIGYNGEPTNVVLVARSNASGLGAAQRAAIEWAAGTLPSVNLVGLVIVADAPGKLPKPLRELAHLVSGGVPQSWHVPWIEAWRLGEAPELEHAPKDVRALIAAVNALTNTTSA